MSNTDQIKAINELKTFAVLHGRLAFAHLCTAALTALEWGSKHDQWAVERMLIAVGRLTIGDGNTDEHKLRIIDSTDTTRPDGAVAKSLKRPV